MDDDQLANLRVNVERAVFSLIDQLEEEGYSKDAAHNVAEARLYNLVRYPFGELPELDADGHLPALLACTLVTIRQRFGNGSERRCTLMAQLDEICQIARTLPSCRLMLGGSFMTSAPFPHDLDIAILVDPTVIKRPEVQRWIQRTELEVHVLVERMESAWWDWFRHFGRPKPPYEKYIGVVEVIL